MVDKKLKMDLYVPVTVPRILMEVPDILPFHVTFFVVRLNWSILLLEYGAWLSKEVFVEQKKLTSFDPTEVHQMTLN